jgi:tetratricopeptide (TPR) repeat protein
MRLRPLAILLLLPLGVSAAESIFSERMKAASALEQGGEYAKAMTLYQGLLHIPGKPLLSWEQELAVRDGMARLLLRQHLFHEAGEVYRAGLSRIQREMEEAPSPALARHGYALALRLGDYPTAVRYCESLLPETCGAEDRAWALEQRCVCYVRQGDWAGVMSFLERQLPTLPQGELRTGLRFLLARACTREGRIDQAEACYRQVLVENPDSQITRVVDVRLRALKAMSTLSVILTPAPDAPVDPQRLCLALSKMVSPLSPDGLAGFRVTRADKDILTVTFLKTTGQPQEITLATVADLEAKAPDVLVFYRRTQEAPKEPEHPGYLGFNFQPLGPELAGFLQLPPGTSGLSVIGVAPGSPAEMGGLRKGDVVLTLNDTPVDLFSVRALVRAIPAGQTARLGVLRAAAERLDLTMKTQEAPPEK